MPSHRPLHRAPLQPQREQAQDGSQAQPRPEQTASYRFGPRRTGRLFAVSLAVVVAFLALPAVGVWILPDQPAVREKVELSVGDEWTEPIDQLICEVDPYAMTGQGWVCGEATVTGSVSEWTDDPERTLRRQVRAHSTVLNPESGHVIATGDNQENLLFFHDSDFSGPTIAMTVRGTGDYDDTVLYAQVMGETVPEVTSVASQIWQALTGTPLADDVLGSIPDVETPRDGYMPSPERPLRPLPGVHEL